MKNDNFTYTTNDQNGTIESSGYLTITKGDHSNMPKRTDAYLDKYERGHLNASSLSGGNHTLNVAPQARDLNHRAYYSMEQGERDALKAGASIYSEKTAYNSGAPGTMPEAYLVNDTITYADGSTQTVHHSFANLNYDVQESMQQTLEQNVDIPDTPNPGDIGREMYSPEEYGALMEECETVMDDVRSEYSSDCSYTSFDTASHDDASFSDSGVGTDADDE
mgnify:CR=1 FL=1